MKKIILSLACLFSFAAHAITYTPISTLNPIGSTSGWVVTSTGPSSAPVWAASTGGGGGGTLAISGGGTGQVTQAAALTALLGSSTVPLANGGTGSTTAAAARTALGLDTAATVATGTSGATIPLLSTANTWTLGQTFTVRPTFNGNTPYDTGNTVAVANGGTGVTTAAAELTRIGAAATASPLSQFAATTSTQFASVVSDETGSGVLVYNTAPSLTNPSLTGGVANTPTTGNSSTQIATTAFVGTAVSNALPIGYTTYTPVVTAASGTYTTASATGAYSQTGKLVCVRITVTITTIGTGTVTLVTLPVATASTNGGIIVLPGRENTAGKMLQGFIGSGSANVTIVDYSGASAAANGASEILSGCYISS